MSILPTFRDPVGSGKTPAFVYRAPGHLVTASDTIGRGKPRGAFAKVIIDVAEA
jgi:hypothetical protein